uniref:Helix-turn-helix domain-containing protein n=1 Tax=Geobacter metallireducens TaxID=28232 RepID=A0A831XDM5_GEOME
METLERHIEDLKARYGNKTFFSFREVEEITGLKKDALYERLSEGLLLAHNPNRAPGGRGTRILACSVWDYIRGGVVPKEKWAE